MKPRLARQTRPWQMPTKPNGRLDRIIGTISEPGFVGIERELVPIVAGATS